MFLVSLYLVQSHYVKLKIVHLMTCFMLLLFYICFHFLPLLPTLRPLCVFIHRFNETPKSLLRIITGVLLDLT